MWLINYHRASLLFRKSLTFLSFIFLITVSGQTVPGPTITSPNVSSLNKFGDVPVSYFTGVPNITIPIHTLTTGKINLPLSLNYHPGSVKPNQHPGWVGLGWNLQSYGSITRTVKGFLDEGDNTSATVFSYYPNPNTPSGNGAAYINTSDWNTEAKLKSFFTINGNNPYYDVQADEFTFNVMGMSGKFFYTADGWQVVCDQNIQIKANGFMDNNEISQTIVTYKHNYAPGLSVQDQSRMFRGFTLTTDDGTQYIFGCSSTSFDPASGVEFSSDYGPSLGFVANSWLLKKIIDINNNEMLFEYERMYPTCNLSYYTTYTDYACYYDWSRASGWETGPVKTYLHGGFLNWPVYLKKITTTNEVIKFNISESIEKKYTDKYLKYSNDDINTEIDLPSLNRDLVNLKWYNLNSITINNVNEEIIQNYQFNYSNSLSQRLTLNSLYESDNSINTNKKYLFTYDDVLALPDYGGNKTDHWGFFNNKDVSGIYFQQLPGNKNTDPVYNIKGLLKTITYPAGGRTEFDWEAHDFSDVVSTDRTKLTPMSELPGTSSYAGGSRIREIRSYSDQTSLATKKKYYYKKLFTKGVDVNTLTSSGVLSGLPQYNFAIINRIGAYQASLVSYNLSTVNSLVSYSNNGSELHIGYSDVIEEISDGSYSKYTFTNFGSDINSTSHFDKIPTTIGWIVGDDKYITMTSLELERGKSTGIFHYNSNNTLVEKTILKYRGDSTRFNNYIKRLDLRNSLSCQVSYDAVILASAYKEFKYNYYIVNKEVTNYDENGLKPIKATTDYAYNTSNLLISQKETQSDLSVLNSKFKFASDFTSISMSPNITPTNNETKGVKNLLLKGATGTLIEKISTRENIDGSNARILGGLLYTFKPDLPVPDKIYSIEKINPIPITSFLQTTIQDNSFQKDISYNLTEVQFDNYDSKNNILQFTTKNGVKESYLWGYNQTLPIAKVLNAENSCCTSVTTSNQSNGYLNVSGNNSTTFTSTNVGDITLNLMPAGGPPPTGLEISYSLTGAASRSGNLCFGFNGYPCNGTPGLITFPNMPIGNYTLNYYSSTSGTTNVLLKYSFQVSQTIMSGVKEIFYNGFEDPSLVYAVTPFAGLKCNPGDYMVDFIMPNSKNYIVDYHYLENGIWKYKSKPYTNNLILSEGDAIDEVRVYPEKAQMTTYTYDPMRGMTSQMDMNGKTVFFYYDQFGRLSFIRDENKNVIKKYCYNYEGQAIDCNINISPILKSTGYTRCKPCPQNNSFISNILEIQKRDVNPNSSTFNALVWEDGGISTSCVPQPSWQTTSTSCVQNSSGQNTGDQVVVSRDINPCSPSYNSTTSTTVSNTYACPPPSPYQIPVYANNSTGSTFTVTFTPTSGGSPYSFYIYSNQNYTIGNIPPDTYNVSISPDGYYNYYYSYNFNGYYTYDYSANFYNQSVYSGGASIYINY